jgi:histidine triad (HIT) family protein
MENPNCIFCKIVRKEIPAEVVSEDESSISFLDINPVNVGHLLVIPKEHHENMIATPDDLVQKLFLKSKILMQAVKEGTGADYVIVSVVGIDVPHFHIHLIPRFNNDNLKGWATKKYENDEKMHEVGEKIKKEINK